MHALRNADIAKNTAMQGPCLSFAVDGSTLTGPQLAIPYQRSQSQFVTSMDPYEYIYAPVRASVDM